MGSEGPAPIPPCSTRTTVHVTGWKKFHGVPHNPTETIVSNLKEFIKRRGLPLPQGITLGSCTVLEAAADAVLPVLHHILNSTHPDAHADADADADADVDASSQILESSSSRSNDQVIWLHFGANAGASKFAIERQAVNEASFLFPDEHGWQPQQLSVVPEDGGISQTRQTTCSIEAIVKHLKMKDFDVVISDDADRFVCNYIYYHSLRFAEQKGHKSLLVHVPLFPRIDEDTQMEFAASLLEALALTL